MWRPAASPPGRRTAGCGGPRRRAAGAGAGANLCRKQALGMAASGAWRRSSARSVASVRPSTWASSKRYHSTAPLRDSGRPGAAPPRGSNMANRDTKGSRGLRVGNPAAEAWAGMVGGGNTATLLESLPCANADTNLDVRQGCQLTCAGNAHSLQHPPSPQLLQHILWLQATRQAGGVGLDAAERGSERARVRNSQGGCAERAQYGLGMHGPSTPHAGCAPTHPKLPQRTAGAAPHTHRM